MEYLEISVSRILNPSPVSFVVGTRSATDASSLARILFGVGGSRIGYLGLEGWRTDGRGNSRVIYVRRVGCHLTFKLRLDGSLRAPAADRGGLHSGGLYLLAAPPQMPSFYLPQAFSRKYRVYGIGWQRMRDYPGYLGRTL